MAQMHEVLNAGGINITERSLRTFLDKGVLPGRKVAEAARSMVSGRRRRCVLNRNEGTSGFANQRSDPRKTASPASRFSGYGYTEVCNGGWFSDMAMAWRFSGRVRRWREAPCCEAAMHRSKNGEPTASISSHSWQRREAPRHGP